MPTPISKGGQKSPPALDASPSTLPATLTDTNTGIKVKVNVPADRIDTPDGVNVAEVLKATARIEREKALMFARQNRHMGTCPSSRGLECACPANLFRKFDELESKTFGDAKLIRVDAGVESFRVVPDPQSPRSPPIKVPHFELPRWVCLKCGWSARATGFNGHACDPSSLIWADAPLPLSAMVNDEKKQKGAFMLTVWRDKDGRYHLGELILDGDMVIERRELSADVYFPAVEGELSDRLMSEFD